MFSIITQCMLEAELELIRTWYVLTFNFSGHIFINFGKNNRS